MGDVLESILAFAFGAAATSIIILLSLAVLVIPLADRLRDHQNHCPRHGRMIAVIVPEGASILSDPVTGVVVCRGVRFLNVPDPDYSSAPRWHDGGGTLMPVWPDP